MKKLIRLTESDLHRIVKESVNRILREAKYDVNSDEWKSNFDLGAEPDWYKGDEAQTNKEIAGYESLPDKARHPYGAEIPDFSNRKHSKYGDKLAAKKPNSVLDRLKQKEWDSMDNFGITQSEWENGTNVPI
jgi:hypothetical protein